MAVIKDLERPRGEIVRIEVSEFKGQKNLNIRIWYTDNQSGDFKPTQKGVTIRPDQYAEFRDAILAAEAELNQS